IRSLFQYMANYLTPPGRNSCRLTSSETDRVNPDANAHVLLSWQLQDTLMQKEEELARLQEENNKLKEFLNSSYVKSLEEKSKRFLSAQRSLDTRPKKRVLQEQGDILTLRHILEGGEGKRTCRNLSLEFCSAEEMAATPPLDSWILETLGLQDEDTIDPESSFSSPTTDHTPSFSSPAPSSDSTTCSPNTDSHCEYSAIDSSCSFSHSMDANTEYSTLDLSPLYTVTSTGSLVSSLPAIVPTGHFTPPRAASTPQRAHSASCSPSCPPGGDGVLFSTPRTTRPALSLPPWKTKEGKGIGSRESPSPICPVGLSRVVHPPHPPPLGKVVHGMLPPHRSYLARPGATRCAPPPRELGVAGRVGAPERRHGGAERVVCP
ncbi:hypothetical protein P4O66_017856, partial [Electrophorus voltai]